MQYYSMCRGIVLEAVINALLVLLCCFLFWLVRLLAEHLATIIWPLNNWLVATELFCSSLKLWATGVGIGVVPLWVGEVEIMGLLWVSGVMFKVLMVAESMVVSAAIGEAGVLQHADITDTTGTS